MGKVAEYPIKHLISFDAVESSSTTASKMTVEEMISEIANYRKRWDTATKDDTYDQEVVKKVEEQFLVNFIFRSNLEEEHGLRTLDETKSFLGRILSRRDFPLPLSLEEQETLNMRNAYENLLAKIKGEELDRDYGLLEASLLKEIHRVILQDIPLPKGLTKPGEMSNKPRMTEFRGEIYYYANPEDMESAVVNLLDKYNFLFDSCTKDGLTNFEDLCDFFKTCAWILLELLDLHPFSDGNGRLCRILSSYSLSKLNPFPTPIYSVWTDSPNDAYIEALVEGRNSPGRMLNIVLTNNLSIRHFNVAEWLECWTCNSGTPSSSPVLTASWICSW